MFKTKALAIALSTAVLASGSANAATIVLSGMVGSWANTVGGTNVTQTPNTPNDPTRLSWGTSQGDGQSSFFFDARNPVTFNNAPNPSLSQYLGTFTHDNRTIAEGTGITSTQLRFTANITIDGFSLGSKMFAFNVNHNETDNNGPNNCCADSVSIVGGVPGNVFSYNGINYTLEFTGFSLTSGGSSNSPGGSSFTTNEDDDNTRRLWARVVATPAVPEPATWAMMIGGLGLVGMSMRRRKTTASFA